MSKKTESIIRNFEHVGNSDMFKIFLGLLGLFNSVFGYFGY